MYIFPSAYVHALFRRPTRIDNSIVYGRSIVNPVGAIQFMSDWYRFAFYATDEFVCSRGEGTDQPAVHRPGDDRRSRWHGTDVHHHLRRS